MEKKEKGLPSNYGNGKKALWENISFAKQKVFGQRPPSAFLSRPPSKSLSNYLLRTLSLRGFGGRYENMFELQHPPMGLGGRSREMDFGRKEAQQMMERQLQVTQPFQNQIQIHSATYRLRNRRCSDKAHPLSSSPAKGDHPRSHSVITCEEKSFAFYSPRSLRKRERRVLGEVLLELRCSDLEEGAGNIFELHHHPMGFGWQIPGNGFREKESTADDGETASNFTKPFPKRIPNKRYRLRKTSTEYRRTKATPNGTPLFTQREPPSKS
ncbi:hypothetical protein CEXT_695271 [Caerostris extrusa]|uniref:Uncharacterized protein n=1 Tax=Caerostris extrusa TaxID=172846 RepID=A0AAV4URX6_CAEEX|nr:hypothetical protein CEXT_695271 [Caerostris extrusa]